MRSSLLIAAFASLTAVSPSIQADDGLFSEVAMESVFEKTLPTTTAVASKQVTGKLDRITGVSSMIDGLKAAGFNPVEKQGRVTMELEHEGWKFPVSFDVHVDLDRIDCTLSLIKISDSAAVTTEKLLLLLGCKDAQGNFFAYDSDSKLIQLRASLPNRSTTAEQIRSDLLRMASLAEKHSEVWLSLKTSPKQSSAKSTESASSSPPISNGQGPNLSPARFTGRWSATLAAGEAFAIQIGTDSKFQLVHLKSGKSAISKGSVTVAGDQMTLTGDGGVTIRGTATQPNSDSFRLAIRDAKGKVTATLDFKKAK